MRSSPFQHLAVAIAAIAALALGSCAGILPGNDPVVVNAERVTAAAADTFDAAFNVEYQNHALLKEKSPAIVAYVNYARTNAPKWLATARQLTQAYKTNRTAANKANLQTAIATLTAAVNQLQTYFPQLQQGGTSP